MPEHADGAPEEDNSCAASVQIDPENTFKASDVRQRRLKISANIARMLLRKMIAEIDCHGLLCDYIGYPYLSKCKDSEWDRLFTDEPFCVGTHQVLFEEALILLWRDLEKRGFVIHDLSFREERIKFPDLAQGHKNIKLGIGFGWDIE